MEGVRVENDLLLIGSHDYIEVTETIEKKEKQEIRTMVQSR